MLIIRTMVLRRVYKKVNIISRWNRAPAGKWAEYCMEPVVVDVSGAIGLKSVVAGCEDF
jgi:hypothetical protein